MMKRVMAFFFLFITASVLLLGDKVSVSQAKPLKMERKIVVFKPEISDEVIKDNLIEKFSGQRIKNLRLINARVAFLSSSAQQNLEKQPGILRIDDDVIVEALLSWNRRIKPTRIPKPTSTPTPTATPTPIATQNLPWGIDRIDADLAWTTSSGSGIKVAIIDTGIDTGHPDLTANIKGGVNTIKSWVGYNDDNGHGTHVAGIVAALNNDYGVVGVGPQIDLYAVKALDRRGSGYLSDVIEGLDWAIQNNMQVVNMSLGTTSDIQSFSEAVQRVNSAGIVQVAAAGNDGKAVNYPAAYPEVIAVSATDQTDTIASWSSRGAEIDLAAPGVSIYSTYKNSAYKTLSGTSMASPHVAGAAALVLTVCETCNPAEVQQRLESTAEDLGISGKDNLYGSGLVDVQKAVTQ